MKTIRDKKIRQILVGALRKNESHLTQKTTPDGKLWQSLTRNKEEASLVRQKDQNAQCINLYGEENNKVHIPAEVQSTLRNAKCSEKEH